MLTSVGIYLYQKLRFIAFRKFIFSVSDSNSDIEGNVFLRRPETLNFNIVKMLKNKLRLHGLLLSIYRKRILELLLFRKVFTWIFMENIELIKFSLLFASFISNSLFNLFFQNFLNIATFGIPYSYLLIFLLSLVVKAIWDFYNNHKLLAKFETVILFSNCVYIVLLCLTLFLIICSTM